MSAAPATSPRAARRAARLQATAERISGLTLPSAPAWLAPLRKAALDRLATLGYPEKRDEYWRYTDPERLISTDVRPAEVFKITDEPPMYQGIDRLKLIWVDGVFSAEDSDPLAGEGLEITRLADSADIHWAADLYGTLEARGQKPVARPLAALNSALATDGVLIRVTGKVSRPVSLIYRRAGTDASVTMHHVIKIEEGGELTLLENGAVAARSSMVIEVEVGDHGTFHHVRTMGRDHERKASTHLFARLGKASKLKSFTLSMNGRLVRNEAMIWLGGAGGTAHLAGAAMGDGMFHHDDTVFITHEAPGCESRQVFKKVLRDGAIGVFQGKILVEQAAQLTDGYQKSQSLLLDERCQFLAKPELEIYADDVKCSHGSTSGEINEDQLFYLRARGVPEQEAKMLLVLAFLAETLDEIEREDIAQDMRLRLRRWLERHS
ncbi:SufB/SufD family protein [Pararhodobacter zhoushanensis]|uniref:SufD family Fe-S cluster assembly protein n=1 Tax=Pararhodobacter zhoushanensis TaxID=2479545 RepID=A0ABT3H1N4_9RHOB|nr:SufD family Fe-S cluster assembly protein [Pararhodobacter zhoushanensis]MCW1933717.1 SufD family Fe-S cluster assembly protein [Pararhodobacter zhoushanensis]